ncbi:sodium/proline symporter [Hirschia litorea]|uniref:Sodium/proline symporter n=1 Tax=Hirschia litorea TaxID=1199156 RepID=A0ABW2IH46_9PROT
MNVSALITLIVYACVLLGVGVWAARKSQSEDSFLLGGRSLGPWVAGLAYAASSSSAWVLLGFSGFVYAVGVSAVWMVPGILAGYAVIWLWSGPVLQKASLEGGNLTLTDFLTHGADKRIAAFIKIAASLMIAFCFSYYVASQFQGAGVAFDGLFGTGLSTGVLIGAAIILAYTFFGGFLAVSVIDTIQGILIGVVAVILPVLAFLEAGGFSGLKEAISIVSEDPNSQNFLHVFGGRTGWIACGFVTGLMATGFGALGQPHLTAWIMATKDTKSRITGAFVAIGWGAVVYAGMAVLGLSARAILGNEAEAESIFFVLAGDLLPMILSGVIAAATLSAIMSTVDSQLLVAGASISHDLGVSRIFKGRDVLALRCGILVVCIAAVLITLNFPSSIFARTLFAWVALGASFGPTVVVRSVGRVPKGWAVLASILIGFALSLLFEFVLEAGPGAVWARSIPWIGAFLPFIVSEVMPALLRKSVTN